MKRFLILLILLNSIFISFSQGNFIYNRYGEKEKLINIDSISFLTIDCSDTIKINTIKSKIWQFDKTTSELSLNTLFTHLDNNRSCQLFQFLGSDSLYIKIHPVFVNSENKIQWTTSRIIVKLSENIDIYHLLNKSNVPYTKVNHIGFDSLMYIITLSSVRDSSIYYSNIIYETRAVVFAQPDFGRFINTNNTHWNQQWALNNTGQDGGSAGVDIKTLNAWKISSGANVKVAVLDNGIQLNHEDLANNVLYGYDATVLGGTSGEYSGSDYHGTCCAGIISAVDNSIGIKGVAYNSKVVPIRIMSIKNILKEIRFIC